MPHAPILEPGHQTATFPDAAANFVKTQVHHVLVYHPIQPRKTDDHIAEQMHQLIPNPGIEPIASSCPAAIQADECPIVGFVDKVFSTQKSKHFRLGALENICLFHASNRLASVKPVTQANAYEHDSGRYSHRKQN